jgi:carboxyl-terminal processing protease
MRRSNPAKHQSPLAKTLWTLLFWVALLATIASSTWACLPEAWQSWDPQHSTLEGTAHTEKVYNAEQPKARRLFVEALQQIETLYADEHFNHQKLDRWKDRYYDQIQNIDDAFVAIESTIASLNDPYTHFFRPDQYAEQNMALSSKLYGIGVEISLVDDAITIMNLLPNSPAMACKCLQMGDVITHIDGVSVQGWTTMNVAKRIRGKKGTSVILTIKPPDAKPEKVKVIRDEIDLLHVQVIDVPKHPDLGFIRLQSFMGAGIANEFRHALDAVRTRPYLIIDLRNNGGGMLSNAIEIADFFLDEQVIVQVDGRGSTYDRIYKGHRGTVYDGKVAVLINEGSASASEVLAGALHEQKNALLVGRQTFGKGMVQEVVPLEAYPVGLTLTVAHYLTPKGQDLNHVGLAPDVKLAEQQIRQASKKGEDVVLDEAIRVLKTN